jgi:hypothetical protein
MKMKIEKRHTKIDPENPILKRGWASDKLDIKFVVHGLNSCPSCWSKISAAGATTRIRINLP